MSFVNIGMLNNFTLNTTSFQPFAYAQNNLYSIFTNSLYSFTPYKTQLFSFPIKANNYKTPSLIDYTKYGQNAAKLKDLSNDMQFKTAQLLDYAKSRGLNVVITSGFRTQEQQRYLQKTRAKYAAKNSLHCQGKAIDIQIVNGSDKDYQELAKYAKAIGMRWGGDFSRVQERWHFDLGWA